MRARAATQDILLTMPARGSLKQARKFAERHAAWIGVRLARLEMSAMITVESKHCALHRRRPSRP